MVTSAEVARGLRHALSSIAYHVAPSRASPRTRVSLLAKKMPNTAGRRDERRTGFGEPIQALERLLLRRYRKVRTRLLIVSPEANDEPAAIHGSCGMTLCQATGKFFSKSSAFLGLATDPIVIPIEMRPIARIAPSNGSYAGRVLRCNCGTRRR